MTAQLSQRTLGLLRRVLEGIQPEDLATQEELSRFWKDALFDFGFAQAVIDVASSYEFEWGDIIPDLFVGRFGRQNSYIANALAPSLCEQTLKRLLAFALFYSRDLRLGDELRQALADDGFDLKTDQNKDFSVPADVQQKLAAVLSAPEIEIINIVLDKFLNLRESTPRKPLVIKFKTPADILDRLVQSSILRTNDQGQHYLPLALAFHYSGSAAALERARRSVEITLHVLRNLYEVEPDKPESHFTFAQIKEHAHKMYANEEGALKLGLYLLQEFSGVLAQYGCDTEGTEVSSVGISENIVRMDISGAWDEHIQQRSQFIEREQSRKRIERNQQTRKEAMAPASKSPILVLISHSSKDEGLASALIDLLQAGLGLLARQIRCSSVDGYRLPAGVNTDAQLLREIADAGLLVGLLAPNSLSSTYVLFELGARWGIQRPMIPLLAGATPEEMPGPHRVLNALSCSNESQLIQFIEDTGRVLEIDPESSSSYLDKVRKVKKLADAVQKGTNPRQTLGEHTPTNATRQAVSATPQEAKPTIDMKTTLPDAAGLINTGPGPNKRLIKRIMRGNEKLMAWEIVRAGLPNVFFAEFTVRNLEPGSCVTADYKVANAQWHEWYKLWSQQPGGFGGASGDGLDGKLPW